MRQRKSISEPMTLDVLLAPLREMFEIKASDTLEQWYYANDNTFLPNRSRDVLVLTPSLSVQDMDTDVVYHPAISARWFYMSTGDSDYTHEITATADGSGVEYYKRTDGSGALVVKKNVTPDNPVGLLCVVTYNDPRNGGISRQVKDKVLLSTNRAANSDTPTIDIETEKTILYNPLIDSTSQFTFTAKVTLKGEDITDTAAIRWYATDNNITTETLIDAVDSPVAKFPCYVSGQNTKTLVVNAINTERTTIIARVLNTTTNQLYPVKAYRTLSWDNVVISAITTADDCSDVRDATRTKTFHNIVNMHGKALTAEEVNANFFQKFILRKASKTKSSTPTDTEEVIGEGSEVTISADKLKSNYSSLVYSELTLKGPYKIVVDANGKVVVDANGKVIISQES